MSGFEIYLACSVTVIGFVFGSAVSALAYRLPRGLSWATGRSKCPTCGHVLEVMDLIPVFSWLIGGGRCRHCRAPISVRYLVTELWCGAWALLLFLQIGLTWTWPLLALWGFLLVALFWIDLDVQLLPDALTFPGTLLGRAAALQLPGGARHAAIGLAIGSGLLWLLAWLWVRFRKIEGMGFGDVKLAAMFGVVLGGPLTVLTLFAAAVAGSLWGLILIRRGQGSGTTALPFGTLLAPAAMVSFLWGSGLVNAYMGLLLGR